MRALEKAKAWARRLREDVLALALAARHPGTPLAAKLVAGLVAAYALSPIDLIPDAIPVLGLLDDLILVPLGIALAIRLVPADVMAACRAEARLRAERPTSRVGLALVAAIWVGTALAAAWLLWPSPR